ncbi:MAG: hypothetical protein WKG00_26570 [Polyangiaceae bacterium]
MPQSASTHPAILVLVLAACVAWVALAEMLEAQRGGLEPARRAMLVRAGGAVVVLGSTLLLGDVALEHARAALHAAEGHRAGPLVLVAYALRLLGA